jgi:hypothetical protein
MPREDRDPADLFALDLALLRGRDRRHELPSIGAHLHFAHANSGPPRPAYAKGRQRRI